MLTDEIKDNLTNRLIPFWKSMHDGENGGFYGWLDYDLALDKKAVKGCILNSRILWFFSNAYLLLGDESLLEEADHACRFLMDHCIDREYGGIYWSVQYDGRVQDDTKHTYNQAFAVYALSSYYAATKKEEAIECARSIIRLIEDKCRDSHGYGEAYNRYFVPVSNEKLSENGVMASRTMNTLLHVFEAYTEYYRVTEDSRTEVLLKEMLDHFADKVYNRNMHRQEVFFDDNWNSLADIHSYGHDIETAWLIDRGCEILSDQNYTDRMGKITRDLTNEIYKTAYRNQSLLNERDGETIKTNRVWWVQAEAMVGFLNGYEKDPSRTEYLEAAEGVWEYIKTYLLDSREGSEWFWDVDEHGQPSSRKPIVEPWKCPYHNGRMCFEIIRRYPHAS